MCHDGMALKKCGGVSGIFINHSAGNAFGGHAPFAGF